LDLSLQGLSQEDRDLIRTRYGLFTFQPGSLQAAPIQVVDAEVPGFLKTVQVAGRHPEIYRLEHRWRSDRLVAYSYEFAGWYDYQTRRGELAVVKSSGDLLHRAVENFLRVLTAHWFLRRGGLLLHASGVVREGMAHLFFGPSGSGKTTVTMLSEGDLVLGDDLVGIRETGSTYEACAVPFRGLYREPPQTGQGFPLAGVNRLVQDQRDFLEEIPPSRRAAEMMASLPFVMGGEGASRALEITGRLANAVTIRRLHFRKSPDFWRLLAPAASPA